MIILDFGSGNTCKNDKNYIAMMIDALAGVDHDRKCVIKWQLFEKAGDNLQLYRESFAYAYDYAKQYGFKTTASVFDLKSLEYLLKHDIPFVKIANNPTLWPLIVSIPDDVPIILSCGYNYGITWWEDHKRAFQNTIEYMCCVSDYPAPVEKYMNFSIDNLRKGISDHTIDNYLFKEYAPDVYECHFKLADSTGPDAGPFARTAQQIKEIL
jgi:sialic acid synthase SpsE